MRTGISVTVSPPEHARLTALIKDRNTTQKHVWRAEIVLLSAEGAGTVEIMRRTGKSKTCVWRWQERFAEQGVEGLLRDKTRPSRIPPLGPEVAEGVIALGKPGGLTATIAGFGTTDTIDVLNRTIVSTTFAGKTLTLLGPSGAIGSLHFSATYAGHHFALASDGHGGTNITFV
jgi:hypothetical protein